MIFDMLKKEQFFGQSFYLKISQGDEGLHRSDSDHRCE